MFRPPWALGAHFGFEGPEENRILVSLSIKVTLLSNQEWLKRHLLEYENYKRHIVKNKEFDKAEMDNFYRKQQFPIPKTTFE